jgi:stage II sporulation protein D
MKMKLWTYGGVALILANACLFGGLRAAELIQNEPADNTPGLESLGARLIGRTHKPPLAIVSPVTVRLFEAEHLTTLGITSPSGFYIADQKMKGHLSIMLNDGKMQVFRGKHFEMSADQLQVTPADSSIFEIRTPRGSHRWTRGELNLLVVKNRIVVVNRLELEDYVDGILEGELGTLHSNPELLKAQAVVARSYILAMRGQNHPGQPYEFCDQPHCQVFVGVLRKKDAAAAAVLSKVRGVYLSYRGLPIAAFYHHNCGGETSAVEDVWPTHAVPYLQGVKEAPNSICRYSPKSRWHLVVSKRWLTACFRHAGWLKRGETLQTIHINREDDAGRVEQLHILASQHDLKVTVGRFRNVLNQYFGGEPLRSALFTMTVRNGAFVIQGRGWGHGVGFCQEGARQLADEGVPYQKILAHYFPHTKLARLH